MVNHGAYSINTSICQIGPLGIVVPTKRKDAAAIIAIARDTGASLYCVAPAPHNAGKTLARALVIYCWKGAGR